MMGLSSVSTLDSSPLSSSRDVANWVKELQRADQTFYNMMTLEIWSLAQTMDEIQPGFWADYMRNRQTIVQQYIKERRRQDPGLDRPSVAKSTSNRKLSPFNGITEKPAKEANGKMIASFSEELERDLPKVTPRSGRSTLAKSQVADAALSNLVIIDVFEDIELSVSQVSAAELAVDESEIAAETTQSRTLTHPFARPTQEGNTTSVKPRTPLPAPSARTPAISLVKLPHLMRFPVLRMAPALVPTPATGNLATAVVACWLTRNFQVQAAGAEGHSGMIKRCDRLTLAPGQSIVCYLGFQLTGLTSGVQVQLVKSLRTHHDLTATWVESPSANDTSSGPSEAMVKLTNRGTQPCVLKAGQAFCRLEFLCSTQASLHGN